MICVSSHHFGPWLLPYPCFHINTHFPQVWKPVSKIDAPLPEHLAHYSLFPSLLTLHLPTSPLIAELTIHNDAAFSFLDGIFPQSAGPTIAGLYATTHFGYLRGDTLQIHLSSIPGFRF
jgi:hypothetical protein